MVLERTDRNINTAVISIVIYTIFITLTPLFIGGDNSFGLIPFITVFILLAIAVETIEQALLAAFEEIDLILIFVLFFKEFMVSLILTSFSIVSVAFIAFRFFGIDVITRNEFVIGILLIFTISSVLYAFYTYKMKIPDKLEEIGNIILIKIFSNYTTQKIEKVSQIKIRLGNELVKLVELSTIVLTVILLGISTFSVIGNENPVLKTEDLFNTLEYKSLFIGLALYAQNTSFTQMNVGCLLSKHAKMVYSCYHEKRSSSLYQWRKKDK